MRWYEAVTACTVRLLMNTTQLTANPKRSLTVNNVLI